MVFVHLSMKEIREDNLWQTVARGKLWNYVSANKFGSSGLLPLFVLPALKKKLVVRRSHEAIRILWQLIHVPALISQWDCASSRKK